jgi:hypothetical protein
MRPVVLCVVAALVGVSHSADARGKKNPIWSLKAPFTPEDNSRWETGAGAVVEGDFVRLTPNLPGRTGYLWSRYANTASSDWQMTVEFKISGDELGGGEGLAWWYTEKRMLGPVFGSADYWNGLGIFFDTFNNDGTGPSPTVVAVYNDGSKPYSVYDDGLQGSLGSCSAPHLRNRKEKSLAKITYLNSELTLELSFSSKDGVPTWQTCFTRIPIELGQDKFFGLTAHTGQPIVTNPPSPQIADNHDIYQITTLDLSPIDAKEQLQQVNQHRERYRKEQEEEHKQMPGYEAAGEGDFQREVMGILRQLEGAIQLLDQSQLNVHQMILKNHDEDSTRNAHIKRKDASTENVAAQDSENLLSLARQLLAAQDSLKRAVAADSSRSSGTGIAIDRRQMAIISSQSARANEAIKSLRAALQAEGPGRTTSSLQTTVSEAMIKEFATYQETASRTVESIIATLDDIDRAADVIVNTLTNPRSRTSSGGSLGWVPTILLTLILGQVVAIVVLQLRRRGTNQKRDKFI